MKTMFYLFSGVLSGTKRMLLFGESEEDTHQILETTQAEVGGGVVGTPRVPKPTKYRELIQAFLIWLQFYFSKKFNYKFAN